jgi:hypothetical protein
VGKAIAQDIELFADFKISQFMSLEEGLWESN